MIRKTSIAFSAVFISLVLGAFLCGCKSQISDEIPVTVTPAMDIRPHWNPDGSKIIFVSDRDGNREIYVMDADGSNQIRLTNDSNRDDYPTWSPDGSKIAYNSYNEEQNDIYIMDADGSNQTNLTESSPSDWFGSWSPDGGKMIFRSNRDGNWELYVMNADGSGQTRLTDNPSYDGNPCWSPDGSKIAFSSNRLLMGLFGDIYVMDAEGADPQNLTNNDVIPGKEIRDIKYGEHERNVLDLWLAVADEPTPLVIYYHGGGFRGGDKRSSMPAPLLLKLLEAGISVAGVNYRLTDTAPFPAQILDSARALQFIRHHAEEYNVESSRIGATGGSAGAAISMWLAFYDDLADPDNKDPILRESTRLTAIVPYNGQSSADPRFIQELFNTDKISSSKIPFFGMSGPEDIQNPKFFPLFEKASAINYASSDDPPVYMYYYQPNLPLPPNSTSRQYSHHPKFGIALKEKLDNLGVECILKFRKDYPDGHPFDEYVKFFCEKFGMTEKKK